MVFPFDYDMPLFRPPSEANSLILQITLGCSWNKCSFCEMYTTKQFRVRPFDAIRSEIQKLSPYAPHIRKVFLADGDAFVLSEQKIITILQEINQNLPAVRRISAYASAKNILQKTDQQLINIRKNGLELLYVGIESGNNDLLQRVNKNETFQSMQQALTRARMAGFRISVMILNGLGGKLYSASHASDSAKLINDIQPEFLSTLVLSFPLGLKHFQQRFSGDFQPLNQFELIQEMYWFLKQLELENTVYRSDHASNYLVLKGNLNRDKQQIISKIEAFLKNPATEKLREEWQRGL